MFTFAACLGLGMVDGAGGHIAVDGQLFAGHPVQCEARANLGHAGRALGDDHKVDDQQDAKNHEAQKDAAAHDEIGEPFDHIARGGCARVPLTDDQLGR